MRRGFIGGHRVVVHAESLRDAGAKALDQNVGRAHERHEHGAVVAVREVEDDAALVAVEREERRIVVARHRSAAPPIDRERSPAGGSTLNKTQLKVE